MSEEKHNSERIAKKMARAGLCSRRDAEQWILDSRVRVNGKLLNSPAFTVSDSDEISVDGKILSAPEETRLFLYHKPAGLVTTHKDEKGRATIFESLPSSLPRVVSVGRLDLNTEGLLLLTNDGALSRYLELPSTGWSRKYRVRVHGKVDEAKLAALKNGITVEGVVYKSILAEIDKSAAEKSGANTWLLITLREGKNREIRKVMEALGLKVNRLIRVSYGPFQLGSLRAQAVQEVKPHILKEQITPFFSGDGQAKNPERPATPNRQNSKPSKPPTRNKPRAGKTKP
jgi:23S rRNA pseudouridine2605 synthase